MTMIPSRIAVASAACSCLLLPMCKRAPVDSTLTDVAGVYTCNIPGPEQTIQLRGDGTSVQTIGTGPEARTYEGHWRLLSSDVSSQVTVFPYRVEWPSYAGVGPPETGGWIAIAKPARDGSIRLIVSEDD